MTVATIDYTLDKQMSQLFSSAGSPLNNGYCQTSIIVALVFNILSKPNKETILFSDVLVDISSTHNAKPG